MEYNAIGGIPPVLPEMSPLIVNNGVFKVATQDAATNVVSNVLGGMASFVNNGTVTKSAGGVANLYLLYEGGGGVSITSGFLVFSNLGFAEGTDFPGLAGVFRVDGLAQLPDPLIVPFGDSVTGLGSVQAPVTNSGTVSPGSYLTAGILTFLGNFTQTTSGVLALALGSSSSVGTYDELDVDGNVTLGGSLTLSLLPSATLTVGTTYTLIDNTGTNPVSGIFPGLANGATFTQAGYWFTISYTGGDDDNDVTVTVVNAPSASYAPTVTNLSTTSGSTGGGTSLTITGTNFIGVSAVKFGSIYATSFTVTDSDHITVVDPPQSAGTVDVTVVTPAGTSATSSADQFTYTTASDPTVTGLSTSSGYTVDDTSVTLTGTNFTGASAVEFGTAEATYFEVVSSTEIIADAPTSATTGTENITVTTPSGTSATSSYNEFTYDAVPDPTVTALSFSAGTTAGGVPVTITGTVFTNANLVDFGGTPGTGLVINSDTSLTVTPPAEYAGTVDITVTSPGGTSADSSADQYTYLASAAPVVTGLGTSSGGSAGGTTVTISGSGFSSAYNVYFGTVEASNFVVNNDDTITAISPSQAAGTVDVTVVSYNGNSTVSSADEFSYSTGSAPTVTGLSVSSGSTNGTTSVTITGTGFTAAQSVSFGSVVTSAFTILSDTPISRHCPGPGGRYQPRRHRHQLRRNIGYFQRRSFHLRRRLGPNGHWPGRDQRHQHRRHRRHHLRHQFHRGNLGQLW